MNQQCKVCGEPAAGFHFGAFTCEGCKSFFGRSYNNASSITECKNNGECVINKKNRTACKACRLRKCYIVGMSKSGSRYGRRSNWFKIHCLLQEQQAAAAQHNANIQNPASRIGASGSYTTGPYPRPSKEEMMLYSLEEHYKQSSASPSISSPDSHNSDSSVENEKRNMLHRKMSDVPPPSLSKDLPPFIPLPFPGLSLMPPPSFLPPPNLLFPGYHPALYPHPQSLLSSSPKDLFHTSSANNNSRFIQNNNNNNSTKKGEDSLSKRFYLDAILSSQKLPFHSEEPSEERAGSEEPPQTKVDAVHKEEISTITPPRSPCTASDQDNPIDLSMKASNSSGTEDRASPRGSDMSEDEHVSNGESRSQHVSEESESDNESSVVYKNDSKRIKIQGTTPLDLTTKA